MPYAEFAECQINLIWLTFGYVMLSETKHLYD